MKLERREGSSERRVLIGMIVDDSVLGTISSKWTKDGLFASRWSNLVGKWCCEHFEKYQAAPKKAVESLFEEWASGNGDKDTVDLVERFLESLSGEYEQAAKESNSEYTLDLAATHFDHVAVERLKEALTSDLEAKDVAKALKRVESFSHVEVGKSHGVDVLANVEAIKSAFRKKADPLIVYPGALGTFFRDALERDALISFMGPEKRGKCVSEDMEVILSDGRVKTIGWIVEHECLTPILTLNESTQRFEAVTVSEFHDNGDKECWEVGTRTGRRVVTTPNHQYLTPDGWKYLENIKVGEFIAVPKRLSFFGDVSMPEAEVKFLAYMLAEGGCTSDQMTWTNIDPVLISDFEESCDSLGIEHRRKGISNHLLKAGWIRKKYRKALWKVSSKTKQIPPCVFQLPKDQVALFLRVFFSCDGHISRESDYIECGLANKKMLRQISHLLLRFGIVHKFDSGLCELNGKVFRSWRVTIRDQENVNTFLRDINFLSVKKRKPCQVQKSKSFLDKFPWQVAEKFLEALKAEYPDPVKALSIKTKGKGKHIRPGYAFQKVFGKKAASIRESIAKKLPVHRQSFSILPDSATKRKFMDSDVLWDEVKSIRSVGQRRTYDLGVPIHHNFVANDCLVHNTFWLLDIAWRAMLQGRKVAFFEVGDMSEGQIMLRFMSRATKRPIRATDPGKVIHYPVSIEHDPDAKQSNVTFEEYEFAEPLHWKEAAAACDNIAKKLGSKGLGPLMRLSCHPNSTLTVGGIASIIQSWERSGWGTPDVVVIDYADVLSPTHGTGDTRDQINATWKALRALSQSLHALVVTATQSDADSYTVETMNMGNFSEDKRKNAHVTGMVGINQAGDEKKLGLQRLNWLALRESEFTPSDVCHVAGCLAVANPAILSSF